MSNVATTSTTCRSYFSTIVLAGIPAGVIDDFHIEQQIVSAAQQKHKENVERAISNGSTNVRIPGPTDSTKRWFVSTFKFILRGIDSYEADNIIDILNHKDDDLIFVDCIQKTKSTKSCIECWMKVSRFAVSSGLGRFRRDPKNEDQ